MAREQRTPIQLPAVTTPTSPTGTKLLLYAKSDGNVYTLNSASTETQLGAGGGGGTTSARAFFLS